MKKKSHYEVLAVEPQAKPAEIKRAYRKKARKAHPDIGGDETVMAEVNRAYDCLSDPARRLLYDQTGFDETKPFAEEVQAVLLAAFSDALGKQAEHCLLHAKRFVEHEQAELAKQVELARQAEKRFRAKKDKIISTKANVFHLLIDQQLGQIKQAVAAMSQQIKVLDGAMKELESYSSSEAVIPKPAIDYRTSMWAGMVTPPG